MKRKNLEQRLSALERRESILFIFVVLFAFMFVFHTWHQNTLNSQYRELHGDLVEVDNEIVKYIRYDKLSTVLNLHGDVDWEAVRINACARHNMTWACKLEELR